MKLRIREAIREDIPVIMELIHELAVFEKAPTEVVNTPELILEQGFGEHPAFICFLAETEGVIIGMALSYIRYSTWKGSCLYLEDLIIKEAFRNRGAGKALFAHTLEYARQKNYYRMSWQVLDWNEPAIRFYESFGAGFEKGWMNSWIDLVAKTK